MIVHRSESHVYTDANGIVLPSVTQVISAVMADHRFSNDKTSMLRGTYVHKACELWSKGELDDDSIDEMLVPYIEGWKLFVKDTGYKAEEWEVMVGHGVYRYAGTLDTHGWMQKRNVLIDIKTGSTPKTVGIQTAAYEEAYGKKFDRYCVTLPGNGRYRMDACKEKTDFQVFCGALNVYNWKMKNGGIREQ